MNVFRRPDTPDMKILMLLLILSVFIHRPASAAAERKLKLLPGFHIAVFASGLGSPRFMAFDGAGRLYVTVPRRGEVVVLPDKDGDGKADERVIFAHGLHNPHGIAFHGGYVYVAEEGRVVRFTDEDADLKGENMEVVAPDLPSDGGHWTRTIGFGPDGKMYLSMGSSCNVCIEEDHRRATIMVFEPDGSHGRVFASGLRNPVGFVWDTTGAMWATDNGRDWLGDDLPPDELNLIEEGARYGWPRCYGDRVPDPDLGDPAFCRNTLPPALEFQAHSAPLGMAFYSGGLFPKEFKGDLLVAFHGSWNRTVPTGYKIVRVRMVDGKTAGIEDFITGWLEGKRAWGRPVDIVVDSHGRMFVSDDRNGIIYIITYAR